MDEEAIKSEYLEHNAELANKAVKTAKKELAAKQRRIDELSLLIQAAYEDKVIGKVPEKICIGLIEKYSAEQDALTSEIERIKKEITETETTKQSADDFIRELKKCYHAPELTREMCYALIDRIIVGAAPKKKGADRRIDIVYKIDISSVLRYKFRK